MNSERVISTAKRRLFVAVSIAMMAVAILFLVEAVLQVTKWCILQKNIGYIQQISSDDIVILSLGESTTYGYGIDEQKNYSFLLENALNELENGRHYRVLNLSWPGAISDDVKNVYDLAMKRLKVAAVIVNMGHNDFLFQANYKMRGEKRKAEMVFSLGLNDGEVDAHLAKAIILPRVFSAIKYMLTNKNDFDMYNGYWRRHRDRLGNSRMVFHDLGSSIPNGWLSGIEDEIVDNLTHNVGYISRKCRKQKVPVLFLGYIHSMSNRYLKRMTETIKTNYVDNEIAGAKQYEQYIISTAWNGERDGFHPNERGHAMISKNIMRALAQFHLLQFETVLVK